MRALLLVAVLLAGCASAPEAPAGTRGKAEAALRSGTAFLLQAQNPDGSWGSPDTVALKDSAMGFDLTPGPQEAVRNAVTALCAQALLRSPLKDAKSGQAAAKALSFLLDRWRTGYEKELTFHCWSYAYTIEALLDGLACPEGAPLRDRIRQTVPGLIEGLRSQQRHEGGWTYYGGPGAQGTSMSFTTATVLLALTRAAREGFELPHGLTEDAAEALRSMRFPDGRFNYGSYLWDKPEIPLSPLGAGARTQAGALALFEDGRRRGKGPGLDTLRESLKGFFETADYLELGRKRIIPHKDAPHMISG